jgi:lipoprotein-anchoring transpeptidase ErfK/SrfK
MLKRQCLALLVFLTVALGGALRAPAGAEGNHLFIRVSFRDATLTLRTSDAAALAQFPVAIPRHLPTQPIEGVVQSVIRDPWWYPTDKTRAAYFKKHGAELPEKIPPGDPQNAMGVGKIVINFNTSEANQTIRIHGTNDPDSIGKRITRGCIRLRNEDWLALAALISGKKTHVLLD